MRRSDRRLELASVICLCLIAAAFPLDAALAQGSPFGVGKPAPPPAEASGLVGWLLAKQAEFYKQFSSLIRLAKQDGSAVWTLLGVSFVYGVFHAAGPGHGKAVISSYLVANDETWRRGIVLSFASALLQAFVAVALVSIAAVLLGATARAMGETVRGIEIVSYALIMLLGLRLIWIKGRALLAALRHWRGERQGVSSAALVGGHAMEIHAPHEHHAHAHHHHAPEHHHHHAHEHDAHCGHSHGPAPSDLAGAGGWRRGFTAIVAVGLRPCSGAILVLVFALAQGLLWAGIAATLAMGLGTAIAVAAIATLAVGAKGLAVRLASGEGRGGAVAIRSLEVAAAVLVSAFAALLLTGYMASERLVVM